MEKDKLPGPEHYQKGRIQVWDFITDQGLDFLEGNVIKYVCRWKHKDGIKDLGKARTYIDKLIENHLAKRVEEGIKLQAGEGAPQSSRLPVQESSEKYYPFKDSEGRRISRKGGK